MNEETSDPRVDMALQRTEWALERTQLAWVRTSFMMISSGLALDKSLSALSESRLIPDNGWVLGGQIGGVLMAAFATLFLTMATWEYVGRAHELRGMGVGRSSRIASALPISLLVLAVGITIATMLLVCG